MKKTDLSLILVFLFFPFVSLATSGACSWHNGVNCSAGATSGGKIICNDGWINSSVYFIDADECYHDSCSIFLMSDVSLSCSAEEDYQRVLNRVEKRRDDCRFSKSIHSLVSTNCDTIDETTLSSCRADIEFYTISQENYKKCVKEEFKKLENKVEQKEVAEDSDKVILFSDGFDAYVQLKMNKNCVKENGDGSVWDKKNQLCSKSYAELNKILQDEAYLNAKPIEEKVEPPVEPIKTQPITKPIIVEKVQEKVVKSDNTEEKIVLPENNIKQDIQPVKKSVGMFGKIRNFFGNIFKFKWF